MRVQDMGSNKRDYQSPRTYAFVGLLCVLLFAGCSPSTPRTKDQGSSSQAQSLMAAVKANDVAGIDAVVRTGVDPDLLEGLRSQLGTVTSEQSLEVPLLVAVRQGHIDAAEALLKAGANPNLRELGIGWGETPLMHASRTGKVQLVSLLLRYGADPRLRYGPFQAKERIADRSDALRYAVVFGHVEIVELLLTAGSPAETDHLAHAIARGQIDIAFLLLSAGADPRLVATTGRSGIDEARILAPRQRTEMEAMMEPFVRPTVKPSRERE